MENIKETKEEKTAEPSLFRNVENKNLDCRLFGYITDLETRNSFYDHADIFLAALGHGEAQTEMPIGKEHLDIYGFVNNAALVAVAEEAMLYSVYSLDLMANIKNCTLEYMAKGEKGQVMIAEAKVTERKEKEIFCEVTVRNQFDLLLAKGSGVYEAYGDFVYTYADYLRKVEGY